MQQPDFWRNRPLTPGLVARALWPFSLVSEYLGQRRLKRGTWEKLSVPVICIGNLNIGGTGKTPMVIALAERLKARGLKPHVVSRGYGGTEIGPLKVHERKNSASQVGDEPMLISAFCTTWVARDRHAGAVAAIQDGADVILLDDGFQNPSLVKDLSIVVTDAVAGFGNARVFPAGPLREAVPVGLERADFLLTIGPAKAQKRFLDTWPDAADQARLKGSLRPLETGMNWKGAKVLAFAGIGHPEKFFATVRGLGAEIIKTEALSDHQPLTRRLMNRLEEESFFKGAQLVTTEKDATRLPEEFKLRVLTLPVRLEIEDWTALDVALERLGLAGEGKA